METKEAVKLNRQLLEILKNLKKRDGRSITWHFEKAVTNYLKAKKIDCRPLRTQNQAI